MDLCGGADAIIVGNSRDVVSGVRCNIRAYESVPVPLIKFDDHSRRLSLEARTDNYVPHVDTFRAHSGESLNVGTVVPLS